MCFLPCCVGAAAAAPVAYYGAKKSISSAIDEQASSNWIAPEIDHEAEEQARLDKLERTKKGFKKRDAVQDIQDKYKSERDSKKATQTRKRK